QVRIAGFLSFALTVLIFEGKVRERLLEGVVCLERQSVLKPAANLRLQRVIIETGRIREDLRQENIRVLLKHNVAHQVVLDQYLGCRSGLAVNEVSEERRVGQECCSAARSLGEYRGLHAAQASEEWIVRSTSGPASKRGPCRSGAGRGRTAAANALSEQSVELSIVDRKVRSSTHEVFEESVVNDVDLVVVNRADQGVTGVAHIADFQDRPEADVLLDPGVPLIHGWKLD